SDRFGARRLTLCGLVAMAGAVVLLGQAWSYTSTLWLFALGAASGALVITPSLAYMAEATSDAGIESFGVAYGIYNMAWGARLLGGPAVGGFLFERMGFRALAIAWAPGVLIVTWLLARVKSVRSPLQPAKEPV